MLLPADLAKVSNLFALIGDCETIVRAIFGVELTELVVSISLQSWVRDEGVQDREAMNHKDRLSSTSDIQHGKRTTLQIDKSTDQPPSDVSCPQRYSHQVVDSHDSFTCLTFTFSTPSRLTADTRNSLTPRKSAPIVR